MGNFIIKIKELITFKYPKGRVNKSVATLVRLRVVEIHYLFYVIVLDFYVNITTKNNDN